MTLTSKVIDGTFPDYARVIPTGNTKRLEVDAAEFAQAVDRVATVSSERSRAVKMALEEDRLILSVNAPDSGAADEELSVAYADERLEIGFNAKYLLEIAGQVDRENAVFLFNSAGRSDADARGQRRVRGLCRDADAGVTRRRCAVGPAHAARASAPTRAAELEFDGRPVAIYGPNGAGKTNLIEAVSLLSPGRGLRGAAGEELARGGDPDGLAAARRDRRRWTAAHEIVSAGATAAGASVEIDGKAATQAALGGVLRVLWLTPAMDRLWMDGAAERRRFLDRVTMSLIPGHARGGARPTTGRCASATGCSATACGTRPGIEAVEARMAAAGADGRGEPAGGAGAARGGAPPADGFPARRR